MVPSVVMTDEYIIQLDPLQEDSLRFIHIESKNTFVLTGAEAFDMLSLMYRHQGELRAIRTGSPFI
ncbi:hypothetical protein [Tengunoibacter tsumagoiensis]|uniref:Uncharacterized protein n=1 Tax=Tengunoibacter tsumagoiensis TaxID=2014871 RepID=A0A402A273_9CHLR|nr:hypothetical protein [Tengunoibacter tsumagoiensis]GCE13149.1 hypothetical protein KTT_30080 [Tengunoibacter tsumagoiensis]